MTIEPNVLRTSRTRLPTEDLSLSKDGIGNIVPAYNNTYDVFIKFSTVPLLISYISKLGFVKDNADPGEYLSLFCSEAVLPGSEIKTSTVAGLRQGVESNYATYRTNQGFNLTYYTQKDYYTNAVFEGWLDFISPIQSSLSGRDDSSIKSVIDDAASYRKLRYPDTYKCDIEISVFSNETLPKYARFKHINELEDSDTKVPTTMTYFMKKCFPTNIVAAPLAYGDAELVKTTVSFKYDYYAVQRVKEFNNTNK